MKQRISSLFASTLVLSAGLAGSASAAPVSVAVSERGANTATCGGVATPCRTLQHALGLVEPGGVINVLESGDYGALGIGKSVDIVYRGTGVALVRPAAAGKNAVTVYAGPNDVVRLRGLTIDGGGTGANGVHFLTGQRLEIVDSAIRNSTQNGVVATNAGGALLIRNSVVSNNRFGVRVRPASGEMKGEIDGLRLYSNSLAGLLVENCADVVVVDSVAMKHRDASAVGFRAVGASARITMRETTVLDNVLGVSALGGGVLRLSNSTVVGNDVAAATASGGIVETFGDNVIRNNTSDGLAALTPVQNH